SCALRTTAWGIVSVAPATPGASPARTRTARPRSTPARAPEPRSTLACDRRSKDYLKNNAQTPIATSATAPTTPATRPSIAGPPVRAGAAGGASTSLGAGFALESGAPMGASGGVKSGTLRRNDSGPGPDVSNSASAATSCAGGGGRKELVESPEEGGGFRS